MIFLKDFKSNWFPSYLIFRIEYYPPGEFFNDCLECIHSVSLETITCFGCLIRRALYHVPKLFHSILTVTVSCTSCVLITCF
jgi:hypothetical protein